MALDLNDKTSNGNTLTNNNSITESSSVPFIGTPYINTTSGLLVAASSQYFSAVDSASLSVTGDLTLQLYVNFVSLPGSGAQMGFFDKYNGDTSNIGFVFYLDNAGGTYKLTFGNSSDGTLGNFTSANVTWTPSTGVWYHLTAVYTASAGSVAFYVDGSQQGSTQTGLKTSIFNNTIALRIGTFGGGSYLDGYVDEMRLWGAARTGGAISGDYQQQLVGNETNLNGYWPLNSLTIPPSSGGFIYMSV